MPVSADTGSDEAVARVRRWLDRCMNEHEKCIDQVSDMLPTRLLRVYGPEDVKLHITADELVPYVCLSHCWGGLNILTTRSDNLDKFCVRNLWYDLPLTFQHAISFAHRLGFAYIWIDNLCIIYNTTYTQQSTWEAYPVTSTHRACRSSTVPRDVYFTPVLNASRAFARKDIVVLQTCSSKAYYRHCQSPKALDGPDLGHH